MLTIGVVEVDGGGDIGLARAAARHPGLALRSVESGDSRSDEVAAVIVDAPVARRAELIAQVAHNWPVPILADSPLAENAERIRLVVDTELVIAANPLHYGLHTRRMMEEVAREGHPLETLFAAWRFQPGASSNTALPLLLDFISTLCPDEVERVTTLERKDATLRLATLRYVSGCIATLEVGAHLPPTYPAPSELVVEGFSVGRAFHCNPGNQSLSVYADAYTAHDWQPDPADAIITALATWLEGSGPRPVGSAQADARALQLAERIQS